MLGFIYSGNTSGVTIDYALSTVINRSK